MSVLPSHSHRVLKSAARVKMFEEVALMRLIPTYLVSRHRADVQAIDIWGGNQALN